MGELSISIAYEPTSLKRLGNMLKVHSFLAPELSSTMQQIGDIIVAAAVANTWAVFDEPTGTLADTIKAVLSGPYEVTIGTDSPYGLRREYGFMGMTDSLGRGPYNDPAKPYMQPALDDNVDQINALINAAVARGLANMGLAI